MLSTVKSWQWNPKPKYTITKIIQIQKEVNPNWGQSIFARSVENIYPGKCSKFPFADKSVNNSWEQNNESYPPPPQQLSQHLIESQISSDEMAQCIGKRSPALCHGYRLSRFLKSISKFQTDLFWNDIEKVARQSLVSKPLTHKKSVNRATKPRLKAKSTP